MINGGLTAPLHPAAAQVYKELDCWNKRHGP